MSTVSPLEIVGAGPAGLAAAIVAAKRGHPVVVRERSPDVGHRFHGDFQGLENWTTEGDVLEEVASLGIEPDFEATPFREQVCFGPDGREHVFRSEQPFYYLVTRGPGPGSLDQALKRQALAAGAEIRFQETVRHPQPGSLVAWGPRRAFALAVGYLFETDLADGAFVALGDRLAPRGYSYLLAHGGRATLASCMFADFCNESLYLERTVELFRSRVSFAMRQPRRFAGVGDLRFPHRPRGGHLRFAGEAAGLQDALWGFGIRFALRSGYYAALAHGGVEAQDSGRLGKNRLGEYLKTAIVNRQGLELARDFGLGRIVKSISRSDSPRGLLRRLYAPSPWKAMAFPLLRLAAKVRRDPRAHRDPGCRCTVCTHDAIATGRS